MPSINQLSYTDTFKTWFDRTNSIISNLNGITVTQIFAGDGIGITSSGGLFTINHGSLVSTGVTFSGSVNFSNPVTFNNTVSFASSPTVSSMVINVTPKTAGITAGNVVRVNGTGLTLAKADSATNAEVLGIVIGENASSNIVALGGVINNTTFSKTIQNLLNISGGTLIGNQAYFLDSQVAGGITTLEPTTANLVSKPVLLGITGDIGAILPYRGQLIGLSSAGISGGISKQTITITATPDTQAFFTGNSINIGDFVWFEEDSAVGAGVVDNTISSEGIVKFGGKLNNSQRNNCVILDHSLQMVSLDFNVTFNPSRFLGLVSKIISQTTDPITNNITATLEITRPSETFETNVGNLEPTLWEYVIGDNSGGFYSMGTYNLRKINSITNPADVKLLDVIFTGANTISVTVYDPNYKTPANISNAITTINNALLVPEVQTDHVWPTLNPNKQIYHYNNAYELTTGQKLPKFVNSLIDGWYVSTCGITFNYFKVGHTGSTDIEIFANYNNNNPVTQYPFPYLLCGYTQAADIQTAVTHPDDIMLFKRAMCPALVNLRKWKDGKDRINSYPYTLQIQVTGITTSSAGDGNTFAGVTLFWYPLRYSSSTNLLGGVSADVVLWQVANSWNDGATASTNSIFVRFGQTVTVNISQPSPHTFSLGNRPVYNSKNGRWYLSTPNYAGATYYNSGAAYLADYSSHYGSVYVPNEETWVGYGLAVPPMESYRGIRVKEFKLIQSSSHYFNTDNTLDVYNETQKYYQHTYPYGITYPRAETSSLAYYDLQLGNLRSQSTYTVPFIAKMSNIPSVVNLYSPVTGLTGAYNKNVSVDMSATNGLLKNLPWDTTTTRTSTTSNNIAVTYMNAEKMVVTINNGAESLDTVQFHYVADGRYNQG